MHLLKIYPSPEERSYIDQIGLTDLRTPEAVVRWLIRQEAERRGLSSENPRLEQSNSGRVLEPEVTP